LKSENDLGFFTNCRRKVLAIFATHPRPPLKNNGFLEMARPMH
jgi:hypothetical protein